MAMTSAKWLCHPKLSSQHFSFLLPKTEQKANGVEHLSQETNTNKHMHIYVHSLQQWSIGLMNIRQSYYFHYAYYLCYYTCSKVDSGYSSAKVRLGTGNALNNLISVTMY